MIDFPNAKINIGLFITEKRTDGYHNIQTIFFPIKFSDALEIQSKEDNTGTQLNNTGIKVDIPAEKNLCYAAYQLIKEDYSIPDVNMHLHKIIPFGAGLGGGSSDAAYTLKMLNQIFELDIPKSQLIQYAEKLGADCAFFIENTPCFAYEKGNLLESVKLDLTGYHLVVVVPALQISTKFAYQGIKPEKKPHSLKKLIQELDIKDWKDFITNDFEQHIFLHYPKLKEIKDKLYSMNASYASMSGSGSSIYGIFREEPEIREQFRNALVWQEKLI